MMIRHLRTSLVAMASIGIFFISPGPAQERQVDSVFPAVERGDANGDWERDLSDAVYLLSYLFSGGPAPVPIHVAPGVTTPLSGDTNGDEKQDMSDAVYLLSWLYLGGPAPVSSEEIITADGGGGGVGRAVQRSIDEWVDAQGTLCLDDGMGGCSLFVPPVANFLGWGDPDSNIFASVDYAGLADDVAGGAFGTTTSGSVTEEPLGDGTSRYHVRLRTRNALSWAIDGRDFGGAPTIFGNRVTDLEDVEPSLGESFLHVVYTHETGAPLTDLFVVLGTTSAISFHARADGTQADGSPGRLQVVQTGIFMTGGGGATADGFPAEKVQILSTGR